MKRRPKKKAGDAIGHGILRVGYPLLQRRVGDLDLGGAYGTRQPVDRQRQQLVKRLEALGGKVNMEEATHVAKHRVRSFHNSVVGYREQLSHDLRDSH